MIIMIFFLKVTCKAVMVSQNAEELGKGNL